MENMYIYRFSAIFSSAPIIKISFDLVPWVGDLRRTGVNFDYLASLQFKEFVARPVPKALDFLEREMSISEMILFKVFPFHLIVLFANSEYHHNSNSQFPCSPLVTVSLHLWLMETVYLILWLGLSDRSSVKKKNAWGAGRAISTLRNRKHVPCFYRVIQTRVEVWENEKCCGNTSGGRVFPQLFRVLPNFHECLYKSIETRSTCFLFLLKNDATKKKGKQFWLSKCKFSLLTSSLR